jgi:hypothetical protein
MVENSGHFRTSVQNRSKASEYFPEYFFDFAVGEPGAPATQDLAAVVRRAEAFRPETGAPSSRAAAAPLRSHELVEAPARGDGGVLAAMAECAQVVRPASLLGRMEPAAVSVTTKQFLKLSAACERRREAPSAACPPAIWRTMFPGEQSVSCETAAAPMPPSSLRNRM